MSDWTYSEDRIVKVGGHWVRVSSIEAIEALPAASGSQIFLRAGHTIKTLVLPDAIVAKAWPEGTP